MVMMFAGIIVISGFTAVFASSLTTQTLQSRVQSVDDLYDVRVGAKAGESPVDILKKRGIKALPFDLIESARIEGVAEWRIFWFVVLPLVRPAIAALAVLIFTFVWNDFFWANVLTQGESAKPITAGVRALNGQFVNNWHLVSAASLMAAIPPVVMFFLMQRHFIAGLTLGAVK